MRFPVFICLLVFIAVGCARRQVTPTRESRRAIDTLFTQHVMLQQASVDSFCLKYGDSIFHVTKDSMLEERMEEMRELVE